VSAFTTLSWFTHTNLLKVEVFNTNFTDEETESQRD
jgi:hypothetical protein